MTFRSYAQNFEDVMLHRTLASIEDGQYVDVGAGDPVVHSVTKSFYDLGWSGMNVEPIARAYRKLAVDRPRDVNLQLALGAKAGTTAFFGIDDFPELSTTVVDLAKQYEHEGRRVEESIVEVATLSQVWDQHIVGDVHFLKIDVEGAEFDVLRGADFTRHRPWVVVIETLTFGARRPSAGRAEKHLAAAGYHKTYFDGLNTFFVADERSRQLDSAFSTPVNSTDDFVVAAGRIARSTLDEVAEQLGLPAGADSSEILERTSHVVADRIEWEKRATQLQRDLERERQSAFERERYVANAGARALAARLETSRVEAELTRMRQSRAWRLSLPLRVLRHPGSYLRALRNR